MNSENEPGTNIPDIAVDEIVIRHIPGGSLFQKPPPKGPAVTSANFKIREGEDYISLGRFRFHTPDEVIQLTNGDRARGSRTAWCHVSVLIAEGFRLEKRPLEGYPGHAGLFGCDKWELGSKATRQFLATLFKFEPIPETATPPSVTQATGPS